MNKNYLIAFLLLLAAKLPAQVLVNVQLPPAGMVQKDQLWNLALVSNQNSFTDASILLDVQDAYTGQTVLAAASRSFTIGKGVKMISIRDVQPVQYNYIATDLNGRFLPLGSYVACYRVTHTTVKGPEPLGEECIRVNINPLSPPLLNTPANNAVLEEKNPQFTWTPPAPLELFNSLAYDLVIAEMMPGQTTAEALLYNTPVFTDHDLRMPYRYYPSSFSKLTEGKTYAWQVTARNGQQYAAQTDSWSFTINKHNDSTAASVSMNSYVLLKRKQDNPGFSYITGNELQVKYYSFDKARETLIRFYDPDGRMIKEIKQRVIYGDNFFNFSLSNDFKKRTGYKIELEDEKGNIYSAGFSLE